MSDFQHSLECLEWQEKIRHDQEEYDRAWPNHCRSCAGYGGSCYTYDPSPRGVSLGYGFMTDCDPCSECAEKNICPRCGLHFDQEGDSSDACPHCHWTMTDGGRPTGMDYCPCEEEYYAKVLREVG